MHEAEFYFYREIPSFPEISYNHLVESKDNTEIT